MGNGLFRRLWGKQEVRVLFLGLSGSGKTTALYRLELGQVVQTIGTSMGFHVGKVQYKGVEIIAFDVVGRCSNRMAFRNYYSDMNGIVIFLDSNDKIRFDYAIEEVVEVVLDGDLRNVPILVLANKQDLPDAYSVEEIHETLAPMFINKIWSVFGVSTTSDKGLQASGLKKAFDWLTDAIVTKETHHVIRKWLPKELGEINDGDQEETSSNDTKTVSDKTIMDSVGSEIYRIFQRRTINKLLNICRTRD